MTNYFQQTPTRGLMQFGLKGRPVSSIEEARAAQIDFDGSVFFFPDIANRRIYTKQINYDGTCTMNMYELGKLPTSDPTVVNGDYITRQEFEEAIKKLREPVQPVSEPGLAQQF